MTKVIVPLPQKESIDFYLQNDIDVFLLGIKKYSENFNNLVDVNELKKYCDLVELKGKKIFIALNKVYYNHQIDELKDLLFFINELHIEAVLFSDISVLNIVNENKLNLNLIWDGRHLATNSYTINFLEKRGVKGVFLSNEITMEEKINIKEKVNVDVCVSLFGHMNMATSSRKLLTNYFRYVKSDNLSLKKYYAKDKAKNESMIVVESENTNFFTNKILNGIMEFPKVIKANIEYIFLDDYLINERSFYNVIEAFSALKKNVNDQEFAIKLKSVIDSNIFNNNDDLFLNKKTIFKVKDYE